MIILIIGGQEMKKMDEVPEKIKTALKNIPGIQYAFIYNSFIQDTKNSEGEVDIMVLGGPDLAEMDDVLTNVESRLERPCFITSFTIREVQQRIRLKDDAILETLQFPKIMLVGDEREMETTLFAES